MAESKELTNFAIDVRDGLREEPKQLPSKYFYDPIGDMLFQKIMELDEYYLTRAELEILQGQKEEILKAFLGQDSAFRLVELGAGDGKKTKVLLDHFTKCKIDFTYSPIDISQSVLNHLKETLDKSQPSLRVEAIQGDYFEALNALKRNHDLKEVVLFLGSTIGNFDSEDAKLFLEELGEGLSTGDLLFIGFDLKKDPDTVLAAYNDEAGITAEFNLNLLDRINNELGGNFDRNSFKHYPTYDPITGETKSYLISKTNQSVYIAELDEVFDFDEYEPIFTEMSQKYSMKMIQEFASASGFRMVKQFNDKRHFYVNVLWEKV